LLDDTATYPQINAGSDALGVLLGLAIADDSRNYPKPIPQQIIDR